MSTLIYYNQDICIALLTVTTHVLIKNHDRQTVVIITDGQSDDIRLSVIASNRVKFNGIRIVGAVVTPNQQSPGLLIILKKIEDMISLL